MKLERRTSKDDDQDKIDRAVELIYELMGLNKQIEPTLWAGAVISVLVMGYKNSGSSYKHFRREMSDALDHYADWWDE